MTESTPRIHVFVTLAAIVVDTVVKQCSAGAEERCNHFVLPSPLSREGISA